MDYHLETFPPILPRPEPTTGSKMAVIPVASCLTTAAPLTSTTLVSQVSAMSSVVGTSGVATVTRGSAAVPLSTVFSKVPIMVVNPMQHKKTSSDPADTLPSQSGQVASSVSSNALRSNKPTSTLQSHEIPKDSVPISSDQNLGNISSKNFISIPNVQLHPSLGNMVVGTVMHNGVLLGSVLLKNNSQYPNISTISSAQVSSQQTSQPIAAISSLVVSSSVTTVTSGSAEIPRSTAFTQVTNQPRAQTTLFAPSQNQQGQLSSFQLGRSLLTPTISGQEKTGEIRMTTATGKDQPSSHACGVLVSNAMNSSVDINASNMSKSKYRPVMKGCYSVKKLTLRQMLILLKEGKDIMTCFKPGTKYFTRTAVFCEALAKFDVFGFKTNLQHGFYDCLISQDFTFKEVMLLKFELECSETYNFVDNIFVMAEETGVIVGEETNPIKSILDLISFPKTNKFPATKQVLSALRAYLHKNQNTLQRTRLEATMMIEALIVAKTSMHLYICKTSSSGIEIDASGSSKKAATDSPSEETDTVYVDSLIKKEPDENVSNKKTSCEETNAGNTFYQFSDLHEVLTSTDGVDRLLNDCKELDDKGSETDESSSFHLGKWKWIMLAETEEYNKGQDVVRHCYLCGLKYDNLIAVWEHIRTVHMEVQNDGSLAAKDSGYVCTHCNKKFATIVEVRRHELSLHLSNYPCYLCGISFDDRYDMLEHVTTSHGKLYRCDICQAHFIEKLELKAHRWEEHKIQYVNDGTLEGSKFTIIYCFFCNKKFCDRRKLSSHINNTHIDALTQLSCGTSCSSCRQPFLDNNALLFHRNIFARSEELKRPLSTTSLKKLCTEFIMKNKESVASKYKEKGKLPREVGCETNASQVKETGELGNSEVGDPHLITELRMLMLNNVKYAYPFKKLFEHCELRNSLQKKLIPRIMDELVRLRLTEFPDMQSDWTILQMDLLFALSRTHKFIRILQKYKLEPLPMNEKIQTRIKIFISKVKAGIYKLEETYNLSILLISLQKHLGHFERKRYAVMNKPVFISKKVTKYYPENWKVSKCQVENITSEGKEESGKPNMETEIHPSTCQKQKPVAIAPKGNLDHRTLNEKDISCFSFGQQIPLSIGNNLQSQSGKHKTASEAMKKILQQNKYERRREKIVKKNAASDDSISGQTSITKSLRERKSSVKYTFNEDVDDSEEEEESVKPSSETDDEWTPPRENYSSELSDEESSDVDVTDDHQGTGTSGNSGDKITGCQSKEETQLKEKSDMGYDEYTKRHSDNDKTMNNNENTGIGSEISQMSPLSKLNDRSDQCSLTNIVFAQKRQGLKPDQDLSPSKMLKIVSSPDSLPTCFKNMHIQNTFIKCSFVRIERNDQADNLCSKVFEVMLNSQEKISMDCGVLSQKRGRGRPRKHSLDSQTNTEVNKQSLSAGRSGRLNENAVELTETFVENRTPVEKELALKFKDVHASMKNPNVSKDMDIEYCESMKASGEFHLEIEREFIETGKIKENGQRKSQEELSSTNENIQCSTRQGLQRKRKRSGEKIEIEQINSDMEKSKFTDEIMLGPKEKRFRIDVSNESETAGGDLSDVESVEHENEEVANNEEKQSPSYELEMTCSTEATSNENPEEDEIFSEYSDDIFSDNNSNDSTQFDFLHKETKRMLSKIVSQPVTQMNPEVIEQTIEHSEVRERALCNDVIVTVGNDQSEKQLQVVENTPSFRIKEEKDDPEYSAASLDSNTAFSVSSVVSSSVENMSTVSIKEERDDSEFSKASSATSNGVCVPCDEKLPTDKPDQPGTKLKPRLAGKVKQNNTVAKSKKKKKETKELQPKPSTPCLRLVPISGTNKFLIVSLATDEFGNVLHNGLPIQTTNMQESLVTQQPQIILQPQSSQPTLVQQTPIQQQQQTPIIQHQQTPIIQQQTPMIQQQIQMMQQQTPVIQQTPVLQQQTPVTHQQTPVIQKQTPVMQQQTPVIQQTPVMQQQTQIMQHQTPIMQQQQTPIMQQQTPIIQQQQTPIIQQQQQTPIMQQLIQQLTPIFQQQQQTSIVQQQTPIIQQLTSILQQQTPVIQQQKSPILQQQPPIIQQLQTSILQQHQQQASTIQQQHTPIIQHQTQMLQQQTPIIQQLQTPIIQQRQQQQQQSSLVQQLQAPIMHQQHSSIKQQPSSIIHQTTSGIQAPQVVQATSTIQPTQIMRQPQMIQTTLEIKQERTTPPIDNKITSGTPTLLSTKHKPNAEQSNVQKANTTSKCEKDMNIVIIKQEVDGDSETASENKKDDIVSRNQVSNLAGLNLSQNQNVTQTSQTVPGQMQMVNVGQIQQRVPVIGSPAGLIQSLVVNQQIPLTVGQFIYVPPDISTSQTDKRSTSQTDARSTSQTDTRSTSQIDTRSTSQTDTRSTSQTDTNTVPPISQGISSTASKTCINKDNQLVDISDLMYTVKPNTIAAVSQTILQRHKTLLPKPVDMIDSICEQEQNKAKALMASSVKKNGQDQIRMPGGFQIFKETSMGGQTSVGDYTEGLIQEIRKDIMSPNQYGKGDSSTAESDDDKEDYKNSKRRTTSQDTKWAFNVFMMWKESCEENVPHLLDMNYTQLNNCLSKFVCEAKKLNGQPYPSKTLYYILAGLLRYLRDNGIFHYNFLDERDPRFTDLHKAWAKRVQELQEEGVDVEIKSADPILPEDEEKLWDLGVFGNNDAESLQMTVFYYACKFFGVRQFEHFTLQQNQFTVGEDECGKWIQFVRDRSSMSKSTRNSSKMGIVDNEIKHHLPDDPHCIADMFKLYLSRIGGGLFYKKPLAGQVINYSDKPLAQAKLKTLMKIIANKAGLSGYFTNRSVVSEPIEYRKVVIKQET